MKISIGYSTCPNDTFIFDAMVHNRLPGQTADWDIQLADVEELNQMANQNTLDITKMSYRAFFDVREQYYLLRSGGALGRGCGPLLISKAALSLNDLSTAKVAIPGYGTTANFLLEYTYPGIKNKLPILFSDIENAVLEGHCDAGLIIHENRFTYSAKGLIKIADLGEVWEEKTGAPIPLGCIVCKKNLGREFAINVQKTIRDSVQYAFDHPEAARPYIHSLAQEMDTAVVQAHIDLYVNEFSIDVGEEGVLAINTMGRLITKNPNFDAMDLFP